MFSLYFFPQTGNSWVNAFYFKHIYSIRIHWFSITYRSETHTSQSWPSLFLQLSWWNIYFLLPHGQVLSWMLDTQRYRGPHLSLDSPLLAHPTLHASIYQHQPSQRQHPVHLSFLPAAALPGYLLSYLYNCINNCSPFLSSLSPTTLDQDLLEISSPTAIKQVQTQETQFHCPH